MTRNHLIRHYGKYIYRHEDYQAICQNDDCAGQILSLFEFWTICRIEEIKRVESYNEQNRKFHCGTLPIPDLWLYETIEDIKAGLISSYGDSSIRVKLKKLKDLGFINERSAKNAFDRTKEYLFNTAIVQSALDEWENTRNNANSEPLKTTHEPLKTTHEPLILEDDLYSSNNPIKQSSLTGAEEPTPPSKRGAKEEEVAQLEISPFVNQPTHSSIANNLSLGSKVPLPPLKQANTNAYSNAADVYELIELWLADSEYMSDATVPIPVREKIKWSNWQLPWRSPFHSVYQSFNPGIVQKLAAELAKKSGGSANDKISHAIATINAWERTKGGWSNLLSLCDRPIKESEPEDACGVDFKSMLKSQHEAIFDRDYLRAGSTEEFYKKCDWYKSWHKYAMTNYPEWSWNAIK